MNGFKLLTIEYNGIYGIIDDYTSDSKVMNYLLKLKEGIDNLDYKHVADIITYDDLLFRLRNIIESIKIKINTKVE